MPRAIRRLGLVPLLAFAAAPVQAGAQRSGYALIFRNEVVPRSSGGAT
jgi:hypothetical protein